MDEFIKLVRVVLKGICKIMDIEIPDEEFMNQYLKSCEILLKREKKGKIGYSEFINWI